MSMSDGIFWTGHASQCGDVEKIATIWYLRNRKPDLFSGLDQQILLMGLMGRENKV